MAGSNTIPELRTFLFSVFRLLKAGKKESCTRIEAEMHKGLADYLQEKYPEAFEECRFHREHLEEINDYFRMQADAEGKEDRLYDCGPEDGLWLVFAIALNTLT